MRFLLINRRHLFLHALIFSCPLMLNVQAQSGNGNQQLAQSVIAGGGGSSSSGSSQVDGTLGQSVTGTSSGGTFTLSSGFWAGAVALTTSTLSATDIVGTYGGTATLTATLTASGSNLSGQLITFTLNGTTVGTSTTDTNGVATLNNVSLSGINAGTYTTVVTAQFAGDTTFTASTGTGQLTVTKATALLQVAGGTFIYDGQPHPATTTVTGVNNVALSPLTVLYNGSSSLPVNAGTYAVTASFAGNQNYNPAVNNQQSIIINKASQTITFNSLSNKTFGDTDFTVSATASSGLSVSFAANGQCSITGSTLHLTGAGSCTVTASQAGNINYNPAIPIEQSIVVAQATTATTVTSSINPSNFGQSVTFTATVISTAGTPTGTIQFKDNGSNLGSPVIVNPSGVATLTTSNLTTGTHAITAVYNGDVNFLTSTGTLSGGQIVGAQPMLSINFSASTYTVAEDGPHTVVTVNRVGDISGAATVDYATSDQAGLPPCSVTNGIASQRCDYAISLGTLRFAAGESSKTIFIPLIDDAFVE
jgi:hypothetical protein